MYNKASYDTIVKVSQANTKENRRRSNVDSSSLSHTRYKCQYHIVFIPKYRKRIMYGRLKADVREIIKKLCDYRNIEIVEGAVCADHVHLCLGIPPSEKVSDVVGYIKGKSALMIHDKYPESVNGYLKIQH
nr:IS200/IS605 family transposase [Blautia massiliensis (ex Durand et al. 2017)]